MDDEIEVPEQEVRPNVSEQLKQAREAAGLSIKDIAAKTRVPIRHLENLEAENFAALPGLTYVLGFVRNYARALELDEGALVGELRDQLSGEDALRRNYVDPVYSAADPARIPPKTFAWGAVAVLALVLIGFGVFKAVSSGMFTGMSAPEADIAEEVKPDAAKPAASAPIGEANGPVILTATDELWLRIYTDDGKTLLEKVMVKGNSYTVPADAVKPMIWTGAPQSLSITVGGKEIPALGGPEKAIKDVELTPAALLARKPEADPEADKAPATTE